ncbi:DUF6185 family protein [Streptomyces sp. NPDC015220]|uniref:DUF6185 family protein n=1 Tax=Streptomyces sp. NPDC015220 TaxID=3364947 RepID=UPI0036F696FC
MGTVWWWLRLAALVAVAVMWCGSPSAEARQNTPDPCRTEQLDTSYVKAVIRFSQHSENYVKVYSDMTVKVPVNKWQPAHHLTFDENSPEYQRAMRCLLRGQENAARNEEWRPHEPQVTAADGWVTVRYEAFAWIQSYKSIRLGPWLIVRSGGDTWNVLLQPAALRKHPWAQVRAELGGMRFADRSERASSATENELVWTGEPPRRIWFEVDLPWKRAFTLGYSQSLWNSANIIAWWVCASFVIALAALRAQRASAPAVPAAPPAGGDGDGPARWRWGRLGARLGRNPARTVVQWAVLSAAVALTLRVVASQPPLALRWRTLICVAAGLALVLIARPWTRGVPPAGSGDRADDPPEPDGVQRRQARAVVVSASVVAALGLLVVFLPALFGLSADLLPRRTQPLAGRTGLVLLGLAALWLWLAAMAAWAWRFAREGGLARAAWTARWDSTPVRCVAVVAGLLAALAVALLVCCWVSWGRQWDRVTWLTAGNDSAARARYFDLSLSQFSLTDLVWVFSRSWVLTGVALVALLHHRVTAAGAQTGRGQQRLTLGPEKPDLLLTVAMFAFIVNLRATAFSGVSAQYVLWFLLSIFSLYAVLAAGRRRSVLCRMGDRFYVQRLSTRRRRHELMTKAHQYRNLNQQLYLLNQGRAGDVTRDAVEDRLHRLHQWLVAACPRRSGAVEVSVLDVALAWGPEGHWWSNALHSARVACCFGLPASVVLVVLDQRAAQNRLETAFSPTGYPEVVVKFFLYQLAWVGAGFVLGALWRLLPGRRSHTRALSLTLAYALPICTAAGLVRATDTDLGYTLVYVLAMLIILTLTSIWMDTETFRAERQFWPSRFALLLSIYQVRGLSVQIAWILTQVTAAIGIWDKLVGA